MVNLTGFVPGTRSVILRVSTETTLTPGRDLLNFAIGEFFDTTIRQLKAECFFLPRNLDLPDGTRTILVDLARSSSSPNDSKVLFSSAVFVNLSKSFDTMIGNSEIFPILWPRFSIISLLDVAAIAEQSPSCLSFLFIFLIVFFHDTGGCANLPFRTPATPAA